MRQNLASHPLPFNSPHMSAVIKRAFLLGAGLGTRLRPLTDVLPKPLIPVFNRPLIEYALDQCLAAGVTEFAVNTHHLPDKWAQCFPDHSYRGAPLTFFHEPVLLETGGGLKNIEEWTQGEPFLVYNGDILATLNLRKLLETHIHSQKAVTMALRSTGHEAHVAAEGESVTDIRRMLGRADGAYQFTGVYCAHPELFLHIPKNKKVSIIPSFLELIRSGKMGASYHDEGIWLDLGTRRSYLEAHLCTGLGKLRHPESVVAASAVVESSALGPGSKVGRNASIRSSILWPGVTVAEGAQLTNCIVYSSTPVAGTQENSDL